jgi:PAS domain S-box-containing protein
VIPAPLIIGLDTVGAAALLAAVAVFVAKAWRPLGGMGRFLLPAILILGLAEEAANFMESWGYLAQADLFEGAISPLLPTLWLFLFAVELGRADQSRLARSYDRLKAVHALALKLTVTMEPKAVMDEIVDAAARLLDAPHVIAFTPDPESQQLVARAWRGISAEEGAAMRIGVAEGIAGKAFCDRRPHVTSRIGEDLSAGTAPIAERYGIVHAVGVPLLFKGNSVGVMALGRRRGEPFTENDIRLMEVFCADAAVAIENAELYRRVVASEARYRALVENSQVAIVVVDADRRILAWNRGAERLFGWTADESFGKHISRIYAEEGRLMPERDILPALQREGLWSGEVPSQRKDGSRFTAFFSLSRVFDAQNRVICTLGIISDVTESVRVREQLYQAQKMQTVGTLAAGIAHDFNNLLTAILGFSGMLRSALPPGTEEHESAVSIETAAQRGSQLVHQLTAFSQKQPVSPQPVDLNHIIQETARLLERTFPKTLALQTRLASDLATVEADPNQIHQVIMNLAVNARDAMPEGGTMTFATENLTLEPGSAEAPGVRPGPCVVLTVSDTGTGIPPEVQPRIFEPFFTTKARAGGTGLGLSTVYAIVMRHGGQITFKSQVGQGTSFRIILPAVSR